MKEKIFVLIMLISMIVYSGMAKGARISIRTIASESIVNPENSRDKRLILCFEENAFELLKSTEIDFATLNIAARISSEIIGTIEVYPVMTSWRNIIKPTWTDPWIKAGGDYDVQNTPGRISIRSSNSEKELAVDITDIIKRWIDEDIPYNGLVIMLSDDDISTSNVAYSIKSEEIKIVVHYTKPK